MGAHGPRLGGTANTSSGVRSSVGLNCVRTIAAGFAAERMACLASAHLHLLTSALCAGLRAGPRRAAASPAAPINP